LVLIFKCYFMKKFIIERKIPGLGNMTSEELQEISKTSNAVISILGKPYHWIQSFVTADTLYCIHEVEDEADILEHAKCGDFPVNKIEEIMTIIDPTTADQPMKAIMR